MNFGVLTLIAALITSLISAYFYFVSRNGDTKLLKSARLFYKITFGIIAFASSYFMYLILSHQFQYDYIYRYSSRDLPLGYLISAFWAGQEGSYLLWTLLISAFGIIFLRTAKQYESWGMFFVLLVKAFFVFLMVDKSPFELLPQTPLDGAGLNPLLQDPWMVVHPPILFVGYAAITFPFALALAAFIKNDFSNWIKEALPWTLLSSITLGAGIIIGGFWAYEVLGWGGFWGWDPVENSSLVPWITILALVHGLLIQKFKNSLIKFNFVLAVVSFVLVIYATFLTRSGVLANFSVHSFQDNGQNVFLTVFMLACLVVGIYLLGRNFPKIKSTKVDPFNLNRESGLFWSMVVFVVSALFISIGTSSPIITGLFASSPSQVDISFYNKVNFPIGILMAALLGITPLLVWGVSTVGLFKKRLLISISLAIVSTIAAYLFGVHKIDLLLFVLSAAFAFWTNSMVIVSQAKISWLNIGGPLAHFGVGMMLIGIIISGNYDRSQQVKLEQHKAGDALGYKLTYHNATDLPNGKTNINIDIGKGGDVFKKHPKLYFSKYNNAWMREPDITIFPLKDLYISVMERQQNTQNASDKLVLSKGEKQNYFDYQIEFLGFEFDNHQMSSNMKIVANLKITYHDSVYSIKPEMIYDNDHKLSPLAKLPSCQGDNLTVVLSNINADTRSVELTFGGFPAEQASAAEVVLVEFSTKPLMNFVWLGSILLTAGTVIAYVRRLKENKAAKNSK